MIRIGVIGCGHWGPNYLRNFSEIDNVQVVAAADRSESALQKIGKRFPGIRLETNYEALLNDDVVDALIIATPASTHYKITGDCLQAGKHVLVEKPLANSSEEALSLARRPLQENQIFMVGHIFRFNSGINKVRELLYEDLIGKVRYLHFMRTNLGPVRRDVSCLMDLAPHDISIALHLLNSMPNRVSAFKGNYLSQSMGDVAFMVMEFPQGEIAHVHVSWIDPEKRREMEVVGTKGLIKFDDMNLAEPVRIIQQSMREVPSYTTFGEFHMVTQARSGIIPAVESKEPLKEQCQEFVRSIQSGNHPLSDVWDGYRICAILEAAEQSAAQGGAAVDIQTAQANGSPT